MKKLVLICLLMFSLSSTALADPITITPTSPTPYLSGPETGQPDIDKVIQSALGLLMVEVYKFNVGDAFDTGSYATAYETVYTNTQNDPSDATMTWTGTGNNFVSDAYLLVKDGKNNPAWYFYDLRSIWDGKETLQLSGFWPERGSISHVALYSNSSPVPEPATLLLFGTGILGIAGLARKKKR